MQTIKSSQLILIVEDSDDDYEATMWAFRKSGNLKNPVHRCVDGQDALDFIYKTGPYQGDEAPRPGMILLDLNMPGIDGHTVLRELKNDPEIKDIPIVVLTTSEDEQDIDACYHEGANTYIQKPVDLDGLFNAIKHLKEYWFEIAILPITKV